MWGALAGAAAGIASSIGGAAMSNAAQVRMYKHRYRWQMSDMRKAGLNPILMSSQLGAGSLSSAQPHSVDFNKTASNVMQSKRQRTELDKIRSETDLTVWLGKKAQADTANSVASTRSQNAQALNYELLQPGLMNQANFDRNYPDRLKAEWMLDRLGGLVGGGIAGAIGGRLFRGKKKPTPSRGDTRGNLRPRSGRNYTPAPYVGPR